MLWGNQNHSLDINVDMWVDFKTVLDKGEETEVYVTVLFV